MSGGPPVTLPAEVDNAVRRASVPPHYRTLFSNLPEPLLLEAWLLADGAQNPAVARQLVKLGMTGGACRLADVHVARTSEEVRVVVRRGRRAYTVAGPDLREGLPAVVKVLLEALFRPGELPELLEKLSFQTSTLATLQAITSHMLTTTDVDKTLYIMLAGVTAGYSLGFNRAVLFVREGETHRYVGSKAIGPASAEEAHRVWEEIEVDEASIEDMIASHDRSGADSPLQQYVRTLSFQVGTDPADEVVTALASPEPVLFQRHAAVSPVLGRLGATGEFVVAMIRARHRTMGILFADNLFSRTPITPSHLRFFRFFTDQTALVWENLLLLKDVEHLAQHDALTGVLSRREFDVRAAQEFARTLRRQSSCAMLVLDLDHFKDVNDRNGHEAGDVALRRVGAILRECLRAGDIVGRFGGDEFTVYLSGIDQADLTALAERVGRAAMASGISLSMGGAWEARAGADPAGLFSLADANLYRAKDAGRGRACLEPGDTVVVFGPGAAP
jgi:diguanylate cyclase (GGDEF)-like protein